MTRIMEAEMADVVRSILQRRRGRAATFAELRDVVPTKIYLSNADMVKSPSRPGEEVWVITMRNIIAHKREGFVSVDGGIGLVVAAKPRKKRGKVSQAEMVAA